MCANVIIVVCSIYALSHVAPMNVVESVELNVSSIFAFSRNVSASTCLRESACEAEDRLMVMTAIGMMFFMAFLIGFFMLEV